MLLSQYTSTVYLMDMHFVPLSVTGLRDAEASKENFNVIQSMYSPLVCLTGLVSLVNITERSIVYK